MGPSTLTVHRLMLVGTLLATKLVDDKRYSNQFWARVSTHAVGSGSSLLQLHEGEKGPILCDRSILIASTELPHGHVPFRGYIFTFIL